MKDWFTTDRRQAIQLFLGSLAPLLILFGFGTEGTWEQILIVTGALLVFIAALLNVLNTKWSDGGWAILRAAIYTLAGTVSPAFVALGLYSAEANTAFLTGLSLALASLNSLLSIFTSGHQKTVAWQERTAEEVAVSNRLRRELAKAYPDSPATDGSSL